MNTGGEPQGERELEELLAGWRRWMVNAQRSPDTIGLRVGHVRHVAGDLLPVSVLEVSSDALIDYLGTQAWKPNTRRSYRASLRGFFGWVQARGLRADNPAALLPQVRVPRSVARPTPEVAYRAALVAASPQVRLMIQLAAICGLRRGEISRVAREDVMRDVVGEWALLVKGKGGHERLVPLPDAMAADIMMLPAGWLFPSTSPRRAGLSLTPAHVGKVITRALPDEWTTHTLRHRCATVAYQKDKDLRAVQELLGHAKPETTAIYTKVPPQALRRLLEATAA